MTEFKAFPKIPHYKHLHCTVTQKIHGTNAAVVITEVDIEGPSASTYKVQAQSRTRFITPEDDNYGFAAWVRANQSALFNFLGPGTHYGEWAGPGINSGEGLTERTFVLFDYWRYKGEPPSQVKLVPVLYNGTFDPQKVTETTDSLKSQGSRLAPGFMRPEGVVITVAGERFKLPFDDEEVKWKQGDKGPKVPKSDRPQGPDVSHLLQPMRLEKLLSRDEAYGRDYPTSLPKIVADYIFDLASERQFDVLDEAIRRELQTQVFRFVKETLK